MEFRVLGALEIRDGDRSIDLAAPKHRVLLAVLLLHPNRAVPVERLIDYLWGEQAPASAMNLVYRSFMTASGRLRRSRARRHRRPVRAGGRRPPGPPHVGRGD